MIIGSRQPDNQKPPVLELASSSRDRENATTILFQSCTCIREPKSRHIRGQFKACVCVPITRHAQQNNQ